MARRVFAGRDLGAMFGKGEGGVGALYVFVIVIVCECISNFIDFNSNLCWGG